MIAEATKMLVKDLRRRSIKVVPPFLYHFTNAEALMGICDRSEIWLGDVRFMNDPTELSFGEGVAQSALGQLEDEPGARLTRELVNGALAGLANGSIPRPPIFAFSMCNSGDALGHWRQYADQGRGYSLAFRSRDLVQLSSASFGLFRVRYNRADQEEVFLAYYRQIARLAAHQEEIAQPEKQLAQLALGLCVISALMKDKSYEPEAEWRIITVIPKRRSGEIKFLARRSSIKPYVIHRFNDLFASLPPGEVALTEVIVGPALEPVVVDSVRMFLSGTDFAAVPVRRSRIPVREVI